MAAFWDWRTRSAPVTERRPAELLTEAPLEAVELYTKNAVVLAEVAPEGQRLSDILNSNSHLPIKNARSISVIAGLDGTERDGWTSIPTDDILFAMPPEHASSRQLRIHRKQHRVRIHTGPYEIAGTAHVLPGVRLDPFVLRSRMRFPGADAGTRAIDQRPGLGTFRSGRAGQRAAADGPDRGGHHLQSPCTSRLTSPRRSATPICLYPVEATLGTVISRTV